jgi:signal transduction histidine kinase
VSTQLSSAASSKLEQLIRRLFALTILLASVETFANAFNQRELLTPLGQVSIWLLLAVVVLIVATSWPKVGTDFFLYAYSGLSFLYMATWPLAIEDPALLPSEFQPWIWWVIGMGVVAMGVVAKPLFALVYLLVTTIAWFLLNTSYFGGAADPWVTLQDSTYIFLFGGTILGLFILVRDSVKKVDLANSAVIQAAVAQASVDATERERQRIDALVHDRVLNTLLLAAKAKTKDEEQSAAKLAKEAISSLRLAEREPDVSSTVSQLGLFRALKRVAEQMNPSIEVEIQSGGAEAIPQQVAQALTEATIQAIDNALRHSKARKIELVLQSIDERGVSIKLRDDGVGFRIDRIPRDRIGVRTSIFARLEAVAGKASVVTGLGEGTEISLEWKP